MTALASSPTMAAPAKTGQVGATNQGASQPATGAAACTKGNAAVGQRRVLKSTQDCICPSTPRALWAHHGMHGHQEGVPCVQRACSHACLVGVCHKQLQLTAAPATGEDVAPTPLGQQSSGQPLFQRGPLQHQTDRTCLTPHMWPTRPQTPRHTRHVGWPVTCTLQAAWLKFASRKRHTATD